MNRANRPTKIKTAENDEDDADTTGTLRKTLNLEGNDYLFNYVNINTFTAIDDLSRFYRSLPSTTSFAM